MPDSTFALQPSIGTWLQCRLSLGRSLEFENSLGPCVVKLHDGGTAVSIPFAKKPSVATWLQWQVVPSAEIECMGTEFVDQDCASTSLAGCAVVVDEPVTRLTPSQAMPWEADFEVDFAGSFAVATLAPATAVSSAPSTCVASMSRVNMSPSTLSSASFSLAPPPKPSGSLSVGTSISVAEVVCIDELPAKKFVEPQVSVPRKPTPRRSEVICTGAVYHDDEASLLDGAGELNDDPLVHGVSRSCRLDDIDSASESEDGRGNTQAWFPQPINVRAARAVVGSVSPASRPTSIDVVGAESKTKDRLAATASGPSTLSANTLTGAAEVAKGVDVDVKAIMHASCKESTITKPSDGLGSMTTVEVPRPVLPAQKSSPHIVEPTMQGLCHFEVRVPRPHPGVQYRRSKRLDDRHDRYAESGTTVVGCVEDDGEWLRIKDGLYLPIRLGGVQLLQPLAVQMENRLSNGRQKRTSSDDAWFFWTWCSGCNGESTSSNMDVGVDVPGHTQVGLSTDLGAIHSVHERHNRDAVTNQ
eukprot:TRINITY_DN54997_c0_g1_i1.p1 TRINITY_DN54997_c0_g1~~TRINITY_DN54997_c0_g1_i1.p1  ORF type:complete len:528 (-),score=61.14 TRINITY_DN54997_c0_g1_i1:142-1725(-)